jgi:hypothetical protein
MNTAQTPLSDNVRQPSELHLPHPSLATRKLTVNFLNALHITRSTEKCNISQLRIVHKHRQVALNPVP